MAVYQIVQNFLPDYFIIYLFTAEMLLKGTQQVSILLVKINNLAYVIYDYIINFELIRKNNLDNCVIR